MLAFPLKPVLDGVSSVSLFITLQKMTAVFTWIWLSCSLGSFPLQIEHIIMYNNYYFGPAMRFPTIGHIKQCRPKLI